MSFVELIMLSLALAMDCFAVSISAGMCLKRFQWKPILLMAIAFGFFQGLMPLLGWSATYKFAPFIQDIDHWIAFVLLLLLGGNMIYQSFNPNPAKPFNPARLRVILTMALATSIDALTVGVTFTCLDTTCLRTLLPAISLIALTSFLMTLLGTFLGIFATKGHSEKFHAECFGGIILIAIGTKILLEHLALL